MMVRRGQTPEGGRDSRITAIAAASGRAAAAAKAAAPKEAGVTSAAPKSTAVKAATAKAAGPKAAAVKAAAVKAAAARAAAAKAAAERAAAEAEDDDEDDEDEEGGKKRRAAPNYITPPGYKRLVAELEFLHTKKRPEVVGALADAAAEGDRSENAEYIYRKKQLREIDRRMRFLAKRLDIVAVVDPTEQKRRDRVFFGATVKVTDEEGQEQTYRIVGVDEIEGAVGAISWRSPIGEGLLGKALGETVTVRWHAGARELTITSIDYV